MLIRKNRLLLTVTMCPRACIRGQTSNNLFPEDLYTSLCNDFMINSFVCVFRVFPGSHHSLSHVVPEDKQTRQDPRQKLQVLIRCPVHLDISSFFIRSIFLFYKSDPVIFKMLCRNQSASTGGSSIDDDNEYQMEWSPNFTMIVQSLCSSVSICICPIDYA